MKPTISITPADLDRFEKEAEKLHKKPLVTHQACIDGMTSATLFERELAMKFAEWKDSNGWLLHKAGVLRKYQVEHFLDKSIAEYVYKTTAELFQKFINEQNQSK